MMYKISNGLDHIEIEYQETFTAWAEITGDGEIADMGVGVELHGFIPRRVDVYEYLRADVVAKIADALIQAWRDEK